MNICYKTKPSLTWFKPGHLYRLDSTIYIFAQLNTDEFALVNLDTGGTKSGITRSNSDGGCHSITKFVDVTEKYCLKEN